MNLSRERFRSRRGFDPSCDLWFIELLRYDLQCTPYRLVRTWPLEPNTTVEGGSSAHSWTI